MFAMAGPLPNRKHEIAAIEWATGAPLLDGYLTAGYKPGYSARFNASRLRNRPHIKARMEELFREAARDAIVGIGWIQRKLIDIAEGREPAKVKTNAVGQRIEEVDRLGALVALARTLGIGDVTVNATASATGGDPLEINDATRIAALEAFMARVKLKQPAPAVLDYTDVDLDDMERRLSNAQR